MRLKEVIAYKPMVGYFIVNRNIEPSQIGMCYMSSLSLSSITSYSRMTARFASDSIQAMSRHRLLAYIEMTLAVVVWGASFIAPSKNI
jgi:hypothetical protein